MSEEIKTYTDTNWEDLLEYNGMTWINIDRFKSLQQKVEQLENIRKEIKEYIEEKVVCCKNGDMLVELNVDDLLNILNKGDNK